MQIFQLKIHLQTSLYTKFLNMYIFDDKNTRIPNS